MSREQSVLDFIRQRPGTWPARLKTGDGALSTVDATWADGKLKVFGHPKRSNPRMQQATEDYFDRKTGTSDWQFSLIIPGFDGWKASVGYLRVAYLAAFAKFGYSFILNPLGVQLREQINNPEREVLRGFTAHASKMPTTSDNLPPTMVQVSVPTPCLAVLLGHRIIILPWPPSGIDPYKAIVEAVGRNLFSMQGDVIPWPRGMELLLDAAVVARDKERK